MDCAHAHGFGQRYDLPIPFWLYLTGAGLTVALSFVMMALYVRSKPTMLGAFRFDLLRTAIGRTLASPGVVAALRVLGVGLYALVVLAGLFGVQSPLKNIAPAMIWAIWWVGMAYVSALVGNLWALVNPLDSLFRLAEALYARLHRGRKLAATYGRLPEALGAWPAVALFLVFVWMELVWEESDVPASLAVALLAYSALTWLGMLLFGRAEWLRRGEAFSVVFGLLARFAPFEGQVADDGVRKWTLRPYAIGLVTDEPVDRSTAVLVIVMLATVTFDGFMETPPWSALLEAFSDPAGNRQAVDAQARMAMQTLGLVGAPLLFLAIYLSFCRLIAWCARGPRAKEGAPIDRGSAARITGLFVLTLIPIAIAYHLAHYLSYLAMAAQYLVPLASDPFGRGWDLFGTRLYFIRLGIVDARMVWYVSVTAIVTGHVAAVYLSHVLALREFPSREAAMRSQWPMLALMVCYTMVSLWIVGQPIVSSR